MNFTVLNQGTEIECSVGTSSIPGISSRFVFGDFASRDDLPTVFSFLEGITGTLLEGYLGSFTKLRFSIQASGVYLTANGEEVASEISGEYQDLYRHTATRNGIVRRTLFEAFHPEKFRNGEASDSAFDEELDGNADSNLRYLVAVNEFTLSIMFPLEYNAHSLSPPYRLRAGLELAVSYVPYNKDHYCILHTIFNRLSGENRKTVIKALCKDREYMARFGVWFQEHRLERFYRDTSFLLDKIEELEQELGISLNVFTFGGRVERYFQSSYRAGADATILNLVLVPRQYFVNPNRPNGFVRECEPINVLSKRNDDTFLTSESILDLVEGADSHCCELELAKDCCPYCTKRLDQRYAETTAHHLKVCFQSFQGVGARDRTKKFVSSPDPVKKFKRFDSMYRVPFATYDWETRIVVETIDGNQVRRHVPFSYAILYLNVFDFAKSRVFLKSSQDPVELVSSFLADVTTVAKLHHGLQSVLHADPAEKAAAEVPEVCPWCKQGGETWEFNHSHFEGDNKNLHLNVYVCKGCNGKAKLRNKPLKFYAHNAAKFDNNLFAAALFNDESFTNFDFIAKNESRFNQISCCVERIPIAFCDSRLLIAGGLGDLAKAWIGEPHMGNVKTLLGIYYGETAEGLDELAGISLKKAVFPYGALNSEEYLEETAPLPKEVFWDELSRENVSEADYGVYLAAHTVLASVLPDFTFLGYHNHYLILDIVLLGMVLFNFMEVNFSLLGLNPLAYMSSPSFSFNSMLKWNLDEATAEIILPKAETQLFVQRGIHGGFTFIFNKTNLKGPMDWTTYFDFTSMYPTVMAQNKLPHRHLESILEPTMGDLEEALADLNHYYFIDVDVAPLDPKFHKRNSILPLFPGAEVVKPEYLSEDQRFRYEQNGGMPFKETTINTVSFFAKKGYVASASYLREAIRLGYVIEKVNRIEKFAQDFVMKGYVDYLYTLKKELTIERDGLKASGGDLEKLAAVCSRLASVKVQLNAIYGFTITNVSKQSEVEMFDESDTKTIRNRISSCRFKSLLRSGEKVIMSKQKGSYELSYPIPLGTAILYESKLLMTKFIYGIWDFLQEKSRVEFPLSFHPCMTDTDSYFFSIGNFGHYWASIDEFSFEFNENKYKVFDTSAHADPKLQHPETHSELGYVTNETGGKAIESFWGLCSKVYSFREAGEEGYDLKGKGISKAAKTKFLSHELYRKVVTGEIFEEDRENLRYDFTQISAGKLALTNQACRKQLVTLVDTKSHYAENGTEYAIFGSEQHKATL